MFVMLIVDELVRVMKPAIENRILVAAGCKKTGAIHSIFFFKIRIDSV